MYLADVTSSASLGAFLTALEEVKLVKQLREIVQETYPK